MKKLMVSVIAICGLSISSCQPAFADLGVTVGKGTASDIQVGVSIDNIRLTYGQGSTDVTGDLFNQSVEYDSYSIGYAFELSEAFNLVPSLGIRKFELDGFTIDNHDSMTRISGKTNKAQLGLGLEYAVRDFSVNLNVINSLSKINASMLGTDSKGKAIQRRASGDYVTDVTLSVTYLF